MIPVRDTIPRRQAPMMTWALIAINAAVFLYELSLGPGELEGLFYVFGVVPARYTHPEWARVVGLPIDDYWPFLTSMFLHGGWYPQPVRRQPSVEYLRIPRRAEQKRSPGPHE